MTIKIRIDRLEVHVHGADAAEILEAIGRFREETMSKFEDVTALLAAMNTVTNQLAANVTVVVENEAKQLAEIQALKDQIAAGTPVTQEQLDSVVSTMQARVDALNATRDQLAAIASTPENPVPEVPPVEEPGTGEPGDEGEGSGEGTEGTANPQ